MDRPSFSADTPVAPVHSYSNDLIHHAYGRAQPFAALEEAPSDHPARKLSAGGQLAPGTSAESVANSGGFHPQTADRSEAADRYITPPLTYIIQGDGSGASHRAAPDAPITVHDLENSGGLGYPISRGGTKFGSLIPRSADPYAPNNVVRAAIVSGQQSSRTFDAIADTVVLGSLHLTQRLFIEAGLQQSLFQNSAELKIASPVRYNALMAERAALPRYASMAKMEGLKTLGGALLVDTAIDQLLFRDSVQSNDTMLADMLVPAVLAFTPAKRLGVAAKLGIIAAEHFGLRAYDYYKQH